jgi:hypothetical protein
MDIMWLPIMKYLKIQMMSYISRSEKETQMKLNKAEKFVKRQFESGLTRNQVREAIWKKLGTWNFPPEYENALATQDPNYDIHDTGRIIGHDYLDDYICDHCGNCHETCFCGDHTEEAEDVIALSQIHTMPEPGTRAHENMVDFMRADLESGMGYSKVVMAAQEIIENSIRCLDCKKITRQDENSTGYCEHCGSANVKRREFDEEFAAWQREKR